MSAVLLQLVGGRKGARHDVQQRSPPRAEAIEGPRLDQLLNGGPADDAVVNALAEVENVFEWTSGLPRPHDLLGGAAADPLDRRQAEDDLTPRHAELAISR